jgi:predicted transcriptional regulator
MTNTQLKESVIDFVKKTDDSDLLKAIKNLFVDDSETVIELSENEKNNIDESIAQIERGEFYSHKEVMEMTKGWLKQ